MEVLVKDDNFDRQSSAFNVLKYKVLSGFLYRREAKIITRWNNGKYELKQVLASTAYIGLCSNLPLSEKVLS